MTKQFSFLCLSLSLVFFSCGGRQSSIAKKEIITEIGKIRFDSSITTFKLATEMSDAMGKKYIYSLHGEDDLTKETPVSGFYIEPLKKMDYLAGKLYLDEFAKNYGKDFGITKLEKIQKSETTINNLKAYIITFIAIDEGKNKNYVTLAILSGEQNSIEFSGNDYENGIYSDKFINTVKSLEM